MSGSIEETMFPRLASYVTIKLNPVKSVELLEDEEATEAARGAVSKVYVGYIAEVRAFNLGSAPRTLAQHH